MTRQTNESRVITTQWWIAFVLLLIMLPMASYSLDAEDLEDARTTGCLQRDGAKPASAACASCHADSEKRFTTNQHRPCSAYCTSCHKKAEMERHHTVGTELVRDVASHLPLTSKKQIACSTCHNLAQPRYDKLRWKSASMFDRIVHKENRYRTYFLSMKNDQGQLCLTCH